MTTSPTSPLEIIALGNAELSEASSWFVRSRRVQMAILIVGLISVVIPDDYSYIPAIAALFAQIGSWFARRHATQRQAIGDEARRRGLLLDALGPTTEPVDIALLLSRISSTARTNMAELEDPNYFYSSSAPGMIRLRDNLQENSFWARCQYEAVAKQYTPILVLFACGALLIGLALLPFAPHQASVVSARMLVTLLSLAPAVTRLNEILAWDAAAKQIAILERRLETLAGHGEDSLRADRLENMLAVFGDYCIATATAPPIPTEIYGRDRGHLNRVWEDRCAR